MAMKRLLLSLSFFIFQLTFALAQSTLADVTKNINKVKRDTMYIYAEATMKDINEA